MNFAVFIDRGSSMPLYSQLEDAIRREIVSGRLTFGEKLPSENEFVSELGLSRMTVRSALSKLENDGVIRKFHGKGTFVCYSSEQQTPKHVDVLLDVTYAYFSTHYIKSISEVLSKHNYQFVIHDTRDDENEIGSILERIADNGPAGVIIQPSHRASSSDEKLRKSAVKLMQRGIPYVIFDRDLSDFPGECISFDDFGGGRKAAEYLVSLGHKRFAMAVCPEFSENVPRRDGFASVLAENGLEPPVEIAQDGDFTVKITDAVRKDGVTAIFAFNDEAALSVCRALSSSGLSVPRDVSVVGYDDTVFAKAANPPLTSVIHPKEQLGRVAAEKLLSIITKNHYEIPKNAFAPDISIRESCARPRK